MRIGLIDYDSKIVNFALMKLSSYHKARGDTVILNPASPTLVDKVYCSVLFTWNRQKAAGLVGAFPQIEFGGTGWDLQACLPDEVEFLSPDYDLYRPEDIAPRLRGIMTSAKRLQKATAVVNAGIGFISRGCVRSCGWCVVPKKEGRLRRVANIGDLLNPRSKTLILLDANLTANPDCLEILKEVKERGLELDITQGIDIRTMTPEIAQALAGVKHLRSMHYSWDETSPAIESAVFRGIELLGRFVKKWRHLCYMLVGYNSSFEQDMYRFRRLIDIGVDPYVMVYNRIDDPRLRHFARWVNGRIYTTCRSFEDYLPWANAREAYLGSPQMELLTAA